MSEEGGVEVDPTTLDYKTTGRASGGTDDNPRDWELPKAPDGTSDTSAKRRRFWPGGARPKNPGEIRLIPKEKD